MESRAYAEAAAKGMLWTHTRRVRAHPDHAENLGGHACLAGVSLAETENEHSEPRPTRRAVVERGVVAHLGVRGDDLECSRVEEDDVADVEEEYSRGRRRRLGGDSRLLPRTCELGTVS